jgi:hypothetical protein
MKSWRTTASGLISSGAALVLFLPTQGVAEPKWLTGIALFVMAGGFASLGIFAKDSNVHSTVDEVQASTIIQTKQAIAQSEATIKDVPTETQKAL